MDRDPFVVSSRHHAARPPLVAGVLVGIGLLLAVMGLTTHLPVASVVGGALAVVGAGLALRKSPDRDDPIFPEDHRSSRRAPSARRMP